VRTLFCQAAEGLFLMPEVLGSFSADKRPVLAHYLKCSERIGGYTSAKKYRMRRPAEALLCISISSFTAKSNRTPWRTEKLRIARSPLRTYECFKYVDLL